MTYQIMVAGFGTGVAVFFTEVSLVFVYRMPE